MGEAHKMNPVFCVPPSVYIRHENLITWRTVMLVTAASYEIRDQAQFTETKGRVSRPRATACPHDLREELIMTLL